MSKRVSKSKVIVKPRAEWFPLPDVTPAIITESEFSQALEARKRSKGACPAKTNSPYLLSGMVRCPLCGSPVSGTTLSGKYRYYKCRGSVPTATRGKICDAHYIKADDLESFVWERFIKILTSPTNQLKLISKEPGEQSSAAVTNDVKLGLDEQISRLKAKIKDFARREKKCYEMLSGDDYNHDLTLDAINKIKQKQKETEREINELESTRKQAGTIKLIAPKISEICDIIQKNADSLGFIEKRQLLQLFRTEIKALPGSFKYTSILNIYKDSHLAYYNLETREYIPFSEAEIDEMMAAAIEGFEEEYPGSTVLDLSESPGEALSNLSLFKQAVISFEKNLVAIE
jgi:site-specific DNA recombinase